MHSATWLIALSLSVEPVVLDRPLPKLVAGPSLREALHRDVSATWDHVELRTVLRRLQDVRGVAVLLDRRIDPNAVFPIRFNGEPLEECFAQLARHADAAVSVTDSAVYIGPTEPAKWLLTAIEQLEARLSEKTLRIPERRQFELSNRRTIHWQDLSTPREILQQIATAYRMEMDGLELVPHDLWAFGTLPQATAAEALSLVLIQFDLGWDWEPGGERVRIEPWKAPPLIERRYTPRGKNLNEALKTWNAALPDAQIRPAVNELIVVGRAEDHQLAQILKITGKLPKEQLNPTAPVPLRRRLFTLKVERVPIRAVMNELEKTGVKFEYDPAALQGTGVSLDALVSLDVQKANADEFFQALFKSAGLRVDIDNLTVTLEPR